MKGLKNWHPFHQLGMKIPLPHFYVLPIDSPSVQCQNFPTHSFQNLNNSFNPFHDLHDIHKFPQTTLVHPTSHLGCTIVILTNLKVLVTFLQSLTSSVQLVRHFMLPNPIQSDPQHPLLVLLVSPNIKIKRMNAFDSILNNPSPLLLLGSSVLIGVYESPHRFSGFPKA